MPPKPQSPRKLQKKKANDGKKVYPPLGQGDSSKASLLSQNSQARIPRAFLLVTLAIKTTNTRSSNDFMIGDFAGIKYHLNIMGFEDKQFFLSTVNLAEYCMAGVHSDIKIRGETSEKVVYSRFKALHRQDDYTFIDESSIKITFHEWMSKTAKDALPGDVVNVILITHGNAQNGNLQFGKNFISIDEMIKILKYFQDSVQVNMVVSACGSGKLCKEISTKDQFNRYIAAAAGPGELSSGNGLVGWVKGQSASGRFRSSYFTDVIIKSLGRINFDRLGPSMGELQQNFHEGVKVKPEPFAAKSTPSFAGSAAKKEEAEIALQKIIHLDYFDFPPDPKRAARYLRQESDMQVVQAADGNNVDDWGFGGDVLDFFATEISKVDESFLSHDDAELHARVQRVLDQTKSGEKATKTEILQAIMFRGKMQSACFSVFMFLQDHCFVTMKGLEKPMNLSSLQDDEIREVSDALSCFELLSDRNEYSFITYCTFNYLPPIIWLSTLIVRGALVRDLWTLFDRMSCMGELGPLDIERLPKVWPETRMIKVDEQAGLVNPLATGNGQPFSFWLPHSMGKNIDLHQVYKYFDADNFMAFEKLYFNYFRLPVDDPKSRERQCSCYIAQQLTSMEN
ncbi:hypothetical protein ONS95_012145 [Cadophora gregata]|uniref:uncharacterized protein n=1 Tax=Cadophora gregata TaxID=51156 RepID=UPI0026DB3E30|nr:uncharacterized protein ONS95_012145 [Cadophora gregata]KAK0117820.1 hypothetical protein ONS95_012145 [Cadophora gregata]KAK0122875.1 hypothetical protein ONS96_009901 [Cadophora gregata f. sp. sojae]